MLLKRAITIHSLYTASLVDWDFQKEKGPRTSLSECISAEYLCLESFLISFENTKQIIEYELHGLY